MVNTKISERSAILEIVPPLAATNARTSAYFNAGLFGRVRALVLVGDASATGTLSLLKASSSTGANSAVVATVAFGGVSAAGDNKAHSMEILPSDLDDDPDRPYYAVSLGDGVALTGAVIEGFDPRYAPPTNDANAIIAR